jgi:hypothetical protein
MDMNATTVPGHDAPDIPPLTGILPGTSANA